MLGLKQTVLSAATAALLAAPVRPAHAGGPLLLLAPHVLGAAVRLATWPLIAASAALSAAAQAPYAQAPSDYDAPPPGYPAPAYPAPYAYAYPAPYPYAAPYAAPTPYYYAARAYRGAYARAPYSYAGGYHYGRMSGYRTAHARGGEFAYRRR